MAKTNFTKVEESLAEGLRKMSVGHLLDMTNKNPQAELLHQRKQTLKLLLLDLQAIAKIEPKIYEQLNTSKSQLKKFAEDPLAITEQEWSDLLKLKERVVVSKKEMEKKKPKVSDEDLISKEVAKHKNKGHNVNANWIPLKK